MKKVFKLAACLALLGTTAVSCQKENDSEPSTDP